MIGARVDVFRKQVVPHGSAGRGVRSRPGVLLARMVLVASSSQVSGCLDDQLDLDPHFLRDTPANPDVEPTEPITEADGGATLNPGKTITLGNLSSFIALDRDFEAFQSWSSFDLGTKGHAVGLPAPTHVYINALPKSSDGEFRVGTLIVKVLETSDDPTTWQVHAMVKRGAAYNSKGAYGWEYFDFTLDGDGIPHQNWRGANVPDGESYQTTVFTSDGKAVQQDVPDCNICHQSSHNDAVNTQALDLDQW